VPGEFVFTRPLAFGPNTRTNSNYWLKTLGLKRGYDGSMRARNVQIFKLDENNPDAGASVALCTNPTRLGFQATRWDVMAIIAKL
jgi:hypothetical protein